ncbi:CapA family protein [Ornithinimicrobium faecis]|uniref:CapA family protein n=1 Tax=Ornithinimicrobium faecis TaxID=2934158 RepID=UPI0021193C33|nr:CapA family protein [Ornithinimicrobium sp. HY1745]
MLVTGALVLALCTLSAPLPGTSDGSDRPSPAPPQVAFPTEPAQEPEPAAAEPVPEPTTQPADPQSTLSPDTEVRLAVVGDIMLGRKVGDRIQAQGTDAVLAGVREELHDADLTIGNLESPLCSGGTADDKAYPLRADPSSLDVLTDGSFDLVSLANNHILDFGPECMDSTTGLLEQADIAHVGVGQTIEAAREPVILESNGMRIAFLAYLQMPVERNGFDSQEWTATDTTPGLAWADPTVIAEDVQAAQTDADHVIVLLHSGFESTEHLSPEQQAAGNAALGAGATAVLGAHPHQLQAAHGRDDGSLVAWSLGNFVFDYPNGWTESDSAVLHLTLGPEGVRESAWSPVLIQDGFPTAVSPDEAAGARILGEVDRMSQEYAESLR